MFEEKNNKQNENKTSLIKFQTNQRDVVKKGRAAGGDGPQGPGRDGERPGRRAAMTGGRRKSPAMTGSDSERPGRRAANARDGGWRAQFSRGAVGGNRPGRRVAAENARNDRAGGGDGPEGPGDDDLARDGGHRAENARDGGRDGPRRRAGGAVLPR